MDDKGLPLAMSKELFRTPTPSTSSTPAPKTRNKREVWVDCDVLCRPRNTKRQMKAKSAANSKKASAAQIPKSDDSSLNLLRDFDKIPSRRHGLPNFKYRETPVRKKAERALLAGHTCEDCCGYYSALNLNDKEKAKVIDRCSRHRSISSSSMTDCYPKDFWSTEVPSTKELIRTGRMKVADYCFDPPRRHSTQKSDDSDQC